MERVSSSFKVQIRLVLYWTDEDDFWLEGLAGLTAVKAEDIWFEKKKTSVRL
jgi:hypothetical protein